MITWSILMDTLKLEGSVFKNRAPVRAVINGRVVNLSLSFDAKHRPYFVDPDDDGCPDVYKDVNFAPAEDR